jgi:hypothetical protein
MKAPISIQTKTICGAGAIASLAFLLSAPAALAQAQIGGYLSAGGPTQTSTPLTPTDVHILPQGPDLSKLHAAPQPAQPAQPAGAADVAARASPAESTTSTVTASGRSDASSATTEVKEVVPTPEAPQPVLADQPQVVDVPTPVLPSPIPAQPRTPGVPLWGVALIAAAALISGRWLARRSRRS